MILSIVILECTTLSLVIPEFAQANIRDRRVPEGAVVPRSRLSTSWSLSSGRPKAGPVGPG